MNIAICEQTFEGKGISPPETGEALIREVRRGLQKHPRSLVPWMLYDPEGSRLFQCITTLPELLPALAPAGVGSGGAAKTGILLEAATRLRNEVIYFPVDVSSMHSMRRARTSAACYRMCSYSRWWRTTSLTRRSWNGSRGPRSRCT